VPDGVGRCFGDELVAVEQRAAARVPGGEPAERALALVLVLDALAAPEWCRDV
jgi:hypothetical protein